MSRMYVMRCVNGDWFVLDDHGHLLVPVFYSNREAMRARDCHCELLPFTPVMLNERSLKDMEWADGECLVSFWLVQSSSTELERGYPLNFAQIALLVSDARNSREDRAPFAQAFSTSI